MLRFGLHFLASIMILFCLQNSVLANEEIAEEYLIVEENKTKLINFMNEKSIPVVKVYSSFSILSANLTDSEIKLLKSNFPAIQIQSNRIYEQSGESELSSAKLVRTTSTTASPYEGIGVKVAILDSGIDTEHRDLKVMGGYCTLKNDCASGIPYDDDNGHGTHVAGIIAALKNNTGIVGIAPKVDLYSIKALNSFGVGSTNSLIDGIEWAIKTKIDILNMSITTDIHDVALQTALKAAYTKGILIVGSAGNNGDTANKAVMYPAKYDTVIAVAAVKSDMTKLKESAVGPEVEIAAPGDYIFSTYPIEWDFHDVKVDGYTHLSGTSMATPHVTGILALYKERFPTKTNIELRNLINDNAKDLGSPGKDDIFGHGLVQYVSSLPGTTTFKVTHELGKAVLSTTTSEAITIESDGKQINAVDGKWTIYGVGGKKTLYITMNDNNGKKVIEKKYIEFDSPSYLDVNNGQPFSGPVGFMSHNKQIKGFDDGTFRPYTTITRGEAAALIGRALGYSSEPASTIFKDVAVSSFASGYIKAAVNAKIISGFTDGTFRPDDFVTRAEMAILISKAFLLKADNTASFKDVHKSMAAYQAIKLLTASGVTLGYGDGTFKPYDKMTRADFSVFLARVQDDSFK